MTHTVAFVGRDEESMSYLARRARSLTVLPCPDIDRFIDQEPEAELAVVVLEDDAAESLEAAARSCNTRGVPFVVLSQVETLKAAVRAMRLGAFDYFLASSDRDDLVDAVLRRLDSPPPHTLSADTSLAPEDTMVGTSQKIQEVYKLIGKISSTNVSVLLRGESGTGKELVARLIHANSSRREHPFVVIDCAAIPRDLVENELFGHEVGAYSGAGARGAGKFDLANRGTVLLDEITELDLDLQSKILRVIQQGTFDRVGGTRPVQVDVRSIAATQANLEELVRESRFRQDLFHRLNVIALYLPPLRDRPEDVPLLVHHFVRKHGRALGVSDREVSRDLMDRLTRYHWPGNVRELENVVRRALLLERGPVMTPRFLEEFPVQGEGPADEAAAMLQRLVAERFLPGELNWKRSDVHRQMMQKLERLLLRIVLRRLGGNQVSASRLLGISRNTLRVKMSQLGIESSSFR